MSVTTRLRSIALACSAVVALAIPAAASAVPLSTNPFSPSSPFNLLVPPNAPIASNGSSLSGVTLGVASDAYTPAVYISSPSDPQYTIHLTSGWGPNALEGKKVRINPAARRANDTDGHMTIIVPQEDIVISLYQAAQGPSGGTWNASWGGIAPLSGSGGNRGDSAGGRESGISQLAGLITPDDVRRGIAEGPDGDLGHALSLLHSQISNSRYLSPAISAGGNSSGGLYMGQRVFLDPALDVNSLTFGGGSLSNRFGRLVARTMQRYGAIVVTNSSGTGLQLVNPLSWTSIGQPNPWPALIGDPRSGYYNYTVQAIPSSRLRAMAPSGGNGVAGPGGSAPATAPAPPPAAGTVPARTPSAGARARSGEVLGDAPAPQGRAQPEPGPHRAGDPFRPRRQGGGRGAPPEGRSEGTGAPHRQGRQEEDHVHGRPRPGGPRQAGQDRPPGQGQGSEGPRPDHPAGDPEGEEVGDTSSSAPLSGGGGPRRTLWPGHVRTAGTGVRRGPAVGKTSGPRPPAAGTPGGEGKTHTAQPGCSTFVALVDGEERALSGPAQEARFSRRLPSNHCSENPKRGELAPDDRRIHDQVGEQGS